MAAPYSIDLRNDLEDLKASLNSGELSAQPISPAA